jgi:arylesterase/paraoxonase
MPMDNLVVDKKGDAYVAAFPDVLRLVEALDGKVPGERRWVDVGSTVFRVKVDEDEEEGFKVEKVLEDVEGVVLPGSTVAVHDVESGMLWMGGVASPFVTVCEVLG